MPRTSAKTSNRFLTHCANCSNTTTKKHAAQHDGLCAVCVNPERHGPTRNEHLIDAGYDAYAREEGHYDIPDWA